jgi:hypothetical protein
MLELLAMPTDFETNFKGRGLLVCFIVFCQKSPQPPTRAVFAQLRNTTTFCSTNAIVKFGRAGAYFRRLLLAELLRVAGDPIVKHVLFPGDRSLDLRFLCLDGALSGFPMRPGADGCQRSPDRHGRPSARLRHRARPDQTLTLHGGATGPRPIAPGRGGQRGEFPASVGGRV